MTTAGDPGAPRRLAAIAWQLHAEAGWPRLRSSGCIASRGLSVVAGDLPQVPACSVRQLVSSPELAAHAGLGQIVRAGKMRAGEKTPAVLAGWCILDGRHGPHSAGAVQAKRIKPETRPDGGALLLTGHA